MECWCPRAVAVAGDGVVKGKTGCNRFAGRAEMDAGMIEFEQLAVTEMT